MSADPIYPRATIEEIAGRHGFSTDELQPMIRYGLVNDIWAIGDTAVLRIPIDEESDRDMLTEAVAAPLAIAAGVKTPDLLVFDDTRTLVPYCFSIYRRAPGVTLGTLEPAPKWEKTFQQVGEQQAIYHELKNVDDPKGWLDQAEPDMLQDCLEEHRGKFLPKQMDEFERWAAVLAEARPYEGEATFIHWDVHPWNVLVDPETADLTAILDWGDAACHDPAEDFGCMPLFAMQAQLRGYGAEYDVDWYGRILKLWLCKVMWELADPDPVKFKRDWWCCPPGGLEEAELLLRSMRGFDRWVPQR